MGRNYCMWLKPATIPPCPLFGLRFHIFSPYSTLWTRKCEWCICSKPACPPLTIPFLYTELPFFMQCLVYLQYPKGILCYSIFAECRDHNNFVTLRVSFISYVFPLFATLSNSNVCKPMQFQKPICYATKELFVFVTGIFVLLNCTENN